MLVIHSPFGRRILSGRTVLLICLVLKKGTGVVAWASYTASTYACQRSPTLGSSTVAIR